MKDPTLGPVFACLYPGLCDIARSYGYALALHGTLVRDMDLIAVPWTESATDAETLRVALQEHIGACGYADLLRRENPELTEDHIKQITSREENSNKEPAAKPHGRLAWNLYLYAGAKVDLSILPRTPQ